MRLDLLASCIIGVMIGLGVPGWFIRWMKGKGGFKRSPRKDDRVAVSNEKKDL